MAITIEGVRVRTTIEALEPGQGFITKVNTSWNYDRHDTNFRSAVRVAEQEGIIGSRLNGHADVYSTAEAVISGSVNQFETDLVNFINLWNASGSDAFTGSGG